MKRNRFLPALGCIALVTGVVVGCGDEGAGTTAPPGQTADTSKEDNTPLEISLVVPQVGDIPAKGNVIEKEIEKYTNTKLNFQWVPSSTYDEKINVMIASGELPKVMRVNYVPTVISAAQNGLFWEVGPYIKDYKNLAAQNPQYYENIKIDGKLYGIPLYREMGRPVFIYRKDWFDALGLKTPKTLDDYYNISKVIATSDPDKNGKNDTFGTILDKRYAEGVSNVITRLAVTQGGLNRYGFDSSGKITPEFVTPQYVDVLKLFRRLYTEKLINQDFAALDSAEADKKIEGGFAAMKLNGVAANPGNMFDRMVKVIPTLVLDESYWEGPQGFKIAAQNGNNGIHVFPKSAVKTEAELKRILKFMDQLLDEKMSTLQKRGIEGVHHKKVENGMVEWTDLTAFNREVKPYRDDLLNFETYNVPPLKDTPLAMKGYKMEAEGVKYAVHNPALNLSSKTFTERGKELDLMISDASTNYIMGKIDDTGWAAAIDKWRKAGGDNMLKEYEEAYAKSKK